MKIQGSTLKWIAMISMLIDHLAVVVFMPAFGIEEYYTIIDSIQIGGTTLLMMCMRWVGRLAFPIFCFLLVEGLVHTHSRVNYLRNLLILAVASEIPYDLAFGGHIVDFRFQNVAFTLVLGFLACWGIDWLDDIQAENPSARGITIKKVILVVVLSFIALKLATDYNAFGVLAIVVLYLWRDHRIKQCLIGALLFGLLTPTAALAFIPIYFYNGERGQQPKYLFYAFYPVHLLGLYLIHLCWSVW